MDDALEIRPLTAADVEVVARLHAESWRTAYRGIFTDRWLDGAVWADRLAHWRGRLTTPGDRAAGLVAERHGVPAGFTYLLADAQPARGTLLDNLHVAPEARGHGLGRVLLGHAARLVQTRGWPPALHLWVFEANAGARRFYERNGGVVVDRVLYDTAERRTHPAICYHWPELTDLVAAVDS